MSLFQKNWELWAAKNPGRLLLEKENFWHKKGGNMEASFAGAPVLLQNRRRVDFGDKKDAVIFGIGLDEYGDEAKEWLSEDPKRHLYLLEDSTDVFSFFLESGKSTWFLESPQVDVIYLTDDIQRNKDFVKLANQTLFSKPLFTGLKSYIENRFQEFDKLKFIYEYMQVMYQFNASEYLDQGKDFLSNFYHNLFRLPESGYANKLFSKFQGVPAIVSGAGPSLQKNIHLLKELDNKALIIAGGTALNALNGYGINPHLTLGADPFETFFYRTLASTAYEVPFIYKTRMNKKALDIVQAPLLYLSGGAGFKIEKWMEDELGIPPPARMNLGLNVVNMGVALAYEMGCNPIITIGVDLAYSGGEKYAPRLEKHASTSDRFRTKSLAEEVIIRSDIYGNPVQTLWKWVHESAWFTEFQRNHPEIHLINATEGGLGFGGVENKTLKEAASSFLTRIYPVKEMVDKAVKEAVFPKPITQSMVAEKLKSLSQGLLKFIEGKDIKHEPVYEHLIEEFENFYKQFLIYNPDLKMDLDVFIKKAVVLNLALIDKAMVEENRKAPFKENRGEGGPGTRYYYGNGNLKTELTPNSVNLYWPEGHLKRTYTLKDGRKEGEDTVYARDGTLLIRACYKNGKPCGETATFYPNGQKSHIRIFTEGGELAREHFLDEAGNDNNFDVNADYFEQISDQMNRLADSFDGIAASLEAMGGNDDDILKLKEELLHLHEIGNEMSVLSGLDKTQSEPLWKTEDASRILKGEVDLFSRHLKTSLDDISKKTKDLRQRQNESP